MRKSMDPSFNLLWSFETSRTKTNRTFRVYFQIKIKLLNRVIKALSESYL
jgi:hypothetical protein